MKCCVHMSISQTHDLHATYHGEKVQAPGRLCRVAGQRGNDNRPHESHSSSEPTLSIIGRKEVTLDSGPVVSSPDCARKCLEIRKSRPKSAANVTATKWSNLRTSDIVQRAELLYI